MSRTDKDQPWWVAAQWWEPQHYRCPNARRWREVRGDRACDLPAEPVVGREAWCRRLRCRWVPIWPARRDGRVLVQSAPPRWFVNHIDTAPTRRRVRDDCRRAVQEYRATGEVDVIPPTDQHRHCATWLWW